MHLEEKDRGGTKSVKQYNAFKNMENYSKAIKTYI